MKILLTGAQGQLGSEVNRHKGFKEKHQVIAMSRQELNIADAETVRATLHLHRPNAIINTAAYTLVDKAESESDKAFEVNAKALEYLATACQELNIPLLHISTDYVFNGQKPTSYVESDNIEPINVYGMSKWQGEEKLRSIAAKHIILRVSWVYGYYGQNFVKTILRLARERKELNIVNDQRGCPTAAKEIAQMLYALIEKIDSGEQAWGTYHFCNGPSTNWYDFAKAIVAHAKNYEPLQVEKILPIQTKDYPTPARRPSNSELCCNKLIDTFAIVPRNWQEVLPEVIEEIYAK
jgi:dTDP-4-dehydrorhamnose reductase